MAGDDEFDAIVAGLTGASAASAAPGIAMVLTPVASAPALAGLCAMSGLRCKVLPSPTGAVAAIELVPSDDPFAELTPSAPAEAAELAGAISRLTHAEVVLLVSKLGTDVGGETGTSGQLSAWKYDHGELTGEASPGLVLAAVDGVVEDVILGVVALRDMAGAEDTGAIPRWKAARMFTRGLRKRKL